MKTAFKIIAGLIVVIIIAIAAVLITFNPNNYKKQITEAVEQQTGRKLTIEGNISLSLFPWIGIEVGKLSLSNASGFSATDFVRISRLDVKVKVLPLLRREVDIDKIRLHGLFVSLETHKDGKTNWQDLIPSESTEVDKQATLVNKPKAGESNTGPALAGMLVNGIDLVGANIQWLDDRTGMQVKISDLNLETGAIKFDNWIPINFSAHVNNSQPEADADIKFDTRFKMNQALDVFNVKNFSLDLKALMKSISPDRIAVAVKMNADADMRQQTIKVTSLNVSALGARLNAALTITNLDTRPLIKGTLSSNTINPRELAGKLGIKLPPSRDSWALSELSFNSHLEASTTSAKLNKLVVKLDKSKLSGFVHVNNIAQPNISYQLALDTIDLDAYLPPPAAPAPASTKAAPPPADVAIKLPLAFLRKLALNGEFSIASLRVSDIAISNILIKTHAADGVIKVDPLSMKLLDGSFAAGLTLDARSTPAYQISANATDIKPAGVVNPLLVGLLGNQKLAVEGVAQFNADIKTHGETLNTLKQAAMGTVSLNMGHTLVTGVDINYYLRNAVAKFAESKNLSVPADFRGTYIPEQKTAFDKVVVHAKLANGKVNNDRLLLDSRRLKVNGSGTINIMNNTLDEKVFVQLDVGRDKTLVEKILQKPVGVRVHGPFAQPAIDVDYHSLSQAITAMLKQEAREKVQEKADAFKAEQKAKLEAKKAAEEQKVKDRLKDKLKGLFGR